MDVLHVLLFLLSVQSAQAIRAIAIAVEYARFGQVFVVSFSVSETESCEEKLLDLDPDSKMMNKKSRKIEGVDNT